MQWQQPQSFTHRQQMGSVSKSYTDAHPPYVQLVSSTDKNHVVAWHPLHMDSDAVIRYIPEATCTHR